MGLIRRHSPSFIEGGVRTAPPAAFRDKEQLLAVPFVAWYAGTPFFHRFSLDGNLLMAEYDDGRVWHVVGFIDHDEPLDFPKWVPPEQPADDNNGEVEL